MPDTQGTTWPDADVPNLLKGGDVWPKVLGGSKTSYRRIWDLMWQQAAKKRGMVKVSVNGNEALVPPLSVHDVLAMVSAWKEAAGRSKGGASFEKWRSYTRAAFAQFKLDERFITDAQDPKHARRPFHAVAGGALLASLWYDTRNLADKLDAEGTVQREMTIDQSAKVRDRMARAEWALQVQERKNAIPLDPKKPVPGVPPVLDPSKPPVTGPATGNWTWLLLLVGALLLTSDGRR